MKKMKIKLQKYLKSENCIIISFLYCQYTRLLFLNLMENMLGVQTFYFDKKFIEFLLDVKTWKQIDEKLI